MKAHYKTRSGRIIFEVEGQSPKDLFRGIAEVQGVFESDTECGCCHSPNIQFRVRQAGKDGAENDYYELFCQDCSAVLSFGQFRKGNSLFVKRKDAEGILLPNHGWKVWRAPATADGGVGKIGAGV